MIQLNFFLLKIDIVKVHKKNMNPFDTKIISRKNLNFIHFNIIFLMNHLFSYTLILNNSLIFYSRN